MVYPTRHGTKRDKLIEKFYRRKSRRAIKSKNKKVSKAEEKLKE
jgi:hypothetical protein